MCIRDRYKTAIASCLGESEQSAKDGLCTSYGAASGCGTMPNWDMSMVKTLSFAFDGRTNFNASIGNWNTSRVRDMRDMFHSATSFNQDIGNWDTSQVEYMQQMFNYATSFNQDISNWTTTQVTNMIDMFKQATAFQAKFTCASVTSGPPSSCSTCVANCATCSTSETNKCATCRTGYSLNDELCFAPAAALTSSTYKFAIASCLGESEQAAKDGLCTSYGAASGYGTMPNWDMSMVTTLSEAFFDKSNLILTLPLAVGTRRK